MGTQILRRWLFASLAISSLIVVSVRYIDRPLARLMAQFHLFQALLAKAPVELPVMIALASLAVLLGAAPCGRQAFAKMGCSRHVGRPSLGVEPLPYRIRSQARVWAHASDCVLTEQPIRVSLVLLGDAFGSFPSGHTDQATAILSILWVFYPRWRSVYAGALFLLAFALILGEWHFLSDVIAGGFIGTLSGVLMMRIWEDVGEQDQSLRTSVKGKD